MTELDPEVKARVLAFVRERERVTVDDVRREFFPDEIGAPYLYLDHLTNEGRLWTLPGDGPMTWVMAGYTNLEPNRVGVEALRKHREEKAARRRAELHAYCEHPITRTELRKCQQARRVVEKPQATRPEVQTTIDPELLSWVRDFIHERETVTLAGVVQEFFPGESHTARIYLSALESEGVILRKSKGKVYEWNHAKEETAPKVSRPSRRKLAEDGEVHELTWDEIHRFGFEEFREFRGWLRGYARYRSDIQLSIQRTETGVKFCMGVPPLKWEAPSKGGWKRTRSNQSRDPDNPYPYGSGLSEESDTVEKSRNSAAFTVPRMASTLYKRMKANRDRQYLFTREWIGREYQNTHPDLIDAALQYLVDKGRISAIPK